MRALAEVWADLNQADTTGTPLHIAPAQGKVEVVRALIEVGADLDQATTKGFWATPLWIAAKAGEVEVMRALVEAATDLDKVASDGTTPLSAARESGYGCVGYANLVHALASGAWRSSLVT